MYYNFEEISYNGYKILNNVEKYGCLQPNYDNIELEKFVFENYHIHDINFNTGSNDHMTKCSEKARFNDSQFFLSRIKDVNVDYSNISNTSFENNNYYDTCSNKLVMQCLIPKNNTCLKSSNIDDYLRPSKDSLNKLFDTDDLNDLMYVGVKSGYSNPNTFGDLNPLSVQESSLNTFISSKKNIYEKCVSYLSDPSSSYGFISDRTFTFYKTEIIDDSLDNIRLKRTEYYQDIYDASFHPNVYQSTIVVPYIDNIKQKFETIICSSDDTNRVGQSISGAIETMAQVTYYMEMLNNELEILKDDISGARNLLRGDINFLKKKQSDLKREAKRLNGYLEKNSGNNGRLHDTLFNKNLKITEIIILSSIIILILFIYMKKK